MQHDDEILICPLHSKQIPLIFTFKFLGAELWCPYCGHTTGAPFGHFKRVKIPGIDLLQEQDRWLEKSKAFRSGEVDAWIYEATDDDLAYDDTE